MRQVLKGSASNVARLVLSALAAMVLPPVLVHHLSQAEYSAWVLILQLSAYINLLDLGLQTVISKMIAENHARGSSEANHHLLSTSFTLLAGVASLGMVLVGIMVWQVPQLFHQMPSTLFPQVRLGLLLMGVSAAVGLPFNPFISVFIGLQSYGLPTLLAVLSRLSSATVLVALVLLHRGLVELTLAVMLVNIATAIAQFYAWRRFARAQVPFSLFRLDRGTASRLLRSGGVIAIWSLAGLFISGLDIIIVGHFDYANTGFYAIAANSTNFMLMIISGLFSPLLPAIASMQVTSTAQSIGKVTLRASRYCTLMLCVFGLPLLVAGFPILSVWVGHTYALKTVLFLEILVISNSLRQLCYPYSLVVIATGQQKLATIASVAEATVNVTVSLWLSSKIGALGVAFGTLAGAAVSVTLHLAVSMRRTRQVIDFPISRFIVHSLLRPLTCVIPLLLLFSSWNRTAMIPARPEFLVIWLFSTLLLIYTISLTADDRKIAWRKLARLSIKKEDLALH